MGRSIRFLRRVINVFSRASFHPALSGNHFFIKSLSGAAIIANDGLR